MQKDSAKLHWLRNWVLTALICLSLKTGNRNYASGILICWHRVWVFHFLNYLRIFNRNPLFVILTNYLYNRSRESSRPSDPGSLFCSWPVPDISQMCCSHACMQVVSVPKAVPTLFPGKGRNKGGTRVPLLFLFFFGEFFFDDVHVLRGDSLTRCKPSIHQFNNILGFSRRTLLP
jgi:hypothetical protein